MAYLKTQTRSCPTCGLTGDVEWVIGVGPRSTKGKPPSRTLRETGPFTRSPKSRATLICPTCETDVP